MNKKFFYGLHRFILTFALIIPLTFVTQTAAATSQCTSTITFESPTTTLVRSFTYIVWGAITGNWTAAYTATIRGVTYQVTANTQCAPK